MNPEELDEARAKEAYRQWQEEGCQGDDIIDVASIAARLAREGWTPPEPEVDPDIWAFMEWWGSEEGDGDPKRAYLAGARMAREQERERANHPIAFAVRVMAGAFKDLDHAKREAREALARIPGRA